VKLSLFRLGLFFSRVVGLLLVCAVFFALTAAAQGSSHAGTAVVFYADPNVAEPMWVPLFNAFRAEVADERREYPLPEDFVPMRAGALTRGQDFSNIVEVRLIGRCDVAEQAYRPLPPGPLGWVVRASGEIQPFIYVDCERLSQYLGPAILGMNSDQRSAAMVRAISRVAVHEWIHIDTQSGKHEAHGIRQAELTGRDLIGPSKAPGGR
jgi:hypothetical protein